MSDGRSAKIVGYEVCVAVRETMVTESVKNFHFKGSKRTAERKAMLKVGAIRIIETQPVTEAEWDRAYGIRQRM